MATVRGSVKDCRHRVDTQTNNKLAQVGQYYIARIRSSSHTLLPGHFAGKLRLPTQIGFDHCAQLIGGRSPSGIAARHLPYHRNDGAPIGGEESLRCAW